MLQAYVTQSLRHKTRQECKLREAQRLKKHTGAPPGGLRASTKCEANILYFLKEKVVTKYLPI